MIVSGTGFVYFTLDWLDDVIYQTICKIVRRFHTLSGVGSTDDDIKIDENTDDPVHDDREVTKLSVHDIVCGFIGSNDSL